MEVLRDKGKIAEVQPDYEALMKREELGFTGLEQGIAVPHAKTQAVCSLEKIFLKPSVDARHCIRTLDTIFLFLFSKTDYIPVKLW